MESRKIALPDSTPAFATNPSTNGTCASSSSRIGPDDLARAIHNPSFYANPDAQSSGPPSSDTQSPVSGHFHKPPVPKLKIKLRPVSDDSGTPLHTTPADEHKDTHGKRKRTVIKVSAKLPNSDENDISSPSFTDTNGTSRTSPQKSREMLNSSQKRRKSDERGTSALSPQANTTATSSASMSNQTVYWPEKAPHEIAKRKRHRQRIIDSIKTGDGRAINLVMPAVDSQTLDGITHQVVTVGDEEFKHVIREHLTRDEFGLYRTSTPKLRIRLKGEPCPLDFRAFPELDNNTDGEYRMPSSSSNAGRSSDAGRDGTGAVPKRGTKRRRGQGTRGKERAVEL